MLSDPEKRQIVDLGGDPLATGGGGGAGGSGGAGVRRLPGHHGRVLRRRRPTRGPRSRTRAGARRDHPARARPGRDRLRRRRPITVDTAVLCTPCSGAGTAPGTHPPPATTCSRPRRGAVRAAHLPRPGRLQPPLPDLPGHRHGHPRARAPTAPATAGSAPAARSPSRSRPASRTACASGCPSQGEVGPGGGPAGDLYVEIHERPHDVFSRKGDDLHCRVTLPMTAAALGTTLTIKTLDGEEDIEVKPGTQSGSVADAPRARACRTCAAPAAATCSCTSTSRRPTRLDRRAGEAAARVRRAARRGPARVPRKPGRPLLPDARRVQRTLTMTATDAGVPELGGAAAVPRSTSCRVRRAAGRRRRGPARGRGAAADAGRAGAGRRRPRARSPRARSSPPGPRACAWRCAPASRCPRQTPEFVLVQALPKGDRGPLAVDLATELGVDRIVPWTASRCVTRWRDDRVAKGVAKWRAAAHAASKQSRRPRVPEVTEPMTTREVCGLLGRRRPRGGAARAGPPSAGGARRSRRPAPSPSSSAPRAGSPTARSWPSAPPVPRPSGWAPRCCARRPPAPPPWPRCRAHPLA